MHISYFLLVLTCKKLRIYLWKGRDWVNLHGVVEGLIHVPDNNGSLSNCPSSHLHLLCSLFKEKERRRWKRAGFTWEIRAGSKTSERAIISTCEAIWSGKPWKTWLWKKQFGIYTNQEIWRATNGRSNECITIGDARCWRSTRLYRIAQR